MAADQDTGGHDDDGADTTTISEMRASNAAPDTPGVDPDTENYASGNDPETAYRNQGRPDGPNSWASYNGKDNSSIDGSVQNADEQTEQQDASGVSQLGDLWGAADPDAANYADLDSITGREDNLQQQDPSADSAAASGSPDLAEPAEVGIEQAPSTERTPSPGQERITALEAERDQAMQKIAGLESSYTELKAELGARLDRLEQRNQEKPAAAISDRALDVDKSPEETTQHEERRRLPSDTRLALGGTIAGIALSTAAEHVSPRSGQMMSYAGDVLSVGIGAIAVWRENRKKNVRRPDN